MTRINCALAATALLLFAGCTNNENAFKAPEFSDIEIRVDGATATIKITISDNRFNECGFYLDDGIEKKEIIATPSIGRFEITLTDLRVDLSYTVQAFARAAGSEICSKPVKFTAPAGYLYIPDPVFREFLLGFCDFDGDQKISQAEAADLWQLPLDNMEIKDLTGIEYMPALEELSCAGGWANNAPQGVLEYVDVSHNANLTLLDLRNNPRLSETIGAFDLTGNLNIRSINLSYTYMDYPALPPFSKIVKLYLSHCKSKFQDLKDFSNLRELDLSYEITGQQFHVDLSSCLNIQIVLLDGIHLKELDLYNQIRLKRLSATNNNLETLDVSRCKNLQYLNLVNQEGDCLKTLYVAPKQIIPGITQDRSAEFLPANTEIIEKSVK